MLPADALIGPGFYKLGYVTNDRDRAIDLWKTQLGIEEFVPFEPAFEARLADGRIGRARLRCAFSAGRKITVEVMEPVEGLVDLFANPLRGRKGLAVEFHHFGLVVDDVALAKAALGSCGVSPVLESDFTPDISFAYYSLPGINHHVEHIHYRGEAGQFLKSVQTRARPGRQG
jgi:hypothetical protein